MRRLCPLSVSVIAWLSLGASAPTPPVEPGLLFRLSANPQFRAQVAAGDPAPTIARNVTVIPDGPAGPAFQCANTQVLAYWAPHNIYSQRGTLSFFWRPRDPVGPTEFPVFRVAFADHSSWDMTWLRIDYNGHGFDAFVTDANLARTRVSTTLAPFPPPSEWIHLALAWDETRGIRFYINGKLAAEKQAEARFDTGLDQFGPHSRIISPHQVQSDYNFVRGGDLAELRTYDRMLPDDSIASLAKGGGAGDLPPLPPRSLADPQTRREWFTRYGWNRPDDPPPLLDAPAVSIRKVEIHDAYDLKRWWWKATDGIRETTWPGVYNRSRLPGRTDYFVLPDWDCYSVSGKAITFVMPDEPWNHLELSGAAWGKMELLKPGTPAAVGLGDQSLPAEALLFERPKGQEKTVHTLAAHTGGSIRFTNVEQEEPIGELSVYNVAAGREPAGTMKLTYRLTSTAPANTTAVEPLLSYVHGRHPADERQFLYATPADATAPATHPSPRPSSPTALPLLHILIPDTWDNLRDGLDGIALDLPALPALTLQPTQGDRLALNLQVKDPLWPMRNMLDFTFSVRPNEPHTLWLDLRDRLLPPGKPLYLTLAGAGQDLTPAALEGATLRLVFKDRQAALPEHTLDRFTQARDSYAMLVEEHPKRPTLNLWARFEADLTDLLRADPNHPLGRQYASAAAIAGATRPPYSLPPVPNGKENAPLWAVRQVQLLARVKGFVNWYIDHRQIENGEFGGGLSDDTDLTNTWPGVALMGGDPDKLADSLRRELEACFNNGMFTRGLPTIQTDELHTYEEGINCLAQNLILDYGNPRQIERAMETQKAMETITGINPAGHRHFRSSYYSGTRIAEDPPWNATKGYSYLVIQPGQLLVDYNGNPEAKKLLLELADGALAHRQVDANGRATTVEAINFLTDAPIGEGRRYLPAHLFWGAYAWTGDKKYLAPLVDAGPGALAGLNGNTLDLLDLRGQMAGNQTPRGGHLAWQLTGDKRLLERLYASQIEQCDLLNFINTEGSLWIDRVNVPHTDLQRARLGGAALVRNTLYPGHAVSWRFRAPATEESLAILIPNATRTSFKVIAHNLDAAPVTATMTGWNIDPGAWEVTQGVDTNNDDTADGPVTNSTAKLERSASIDLTFPPKATTVLNFQLRTPGTPYWSRPDLGIAREDVRPAPDGLHITVHSLGSVDAPAARLRLLDKSGKELATAPIPPLPAPIDLQPRRSEILLPLPAGTSYEGGTLEIDSGDTEEITRLNNRVRL
jgi:hypothetical protein